MISFGKFEMECEYHIWTGRKAACSHRRNKDNMRVRHPICNKYNCPFYGLD